MREHKSMINKRFVEAIKIVISTQKIRKGTIADSVNISKSKLSEILNQRMNVSSDLVATFCEKYHFSPNWIITGKGTMYGERIEKEYLKKLQERNQEILKLSKQLEEALIDLESVVDKVPREE
ncbi:MAG: hypothetical protein LBM67_09430 [Lentimicrobiaceae bacterium]|jgi:phage terminase small subunit|nr:hypothetical protein [Lentimicrobiaceae bacterium]